MKLYYSKGACSLATRIIINELGLKCEFESVDLAKKLTQSGQNFYEINPKGSVPAITTDKGETLTEGAVIMQYLADTAKAEQLLPAVGNIKRYRVLEWLNYVATELHKGIGQLFSQNLSQETKDTVLKPIIKKKLAFVNNNLEKNKFICSDNFTLPDGYLFVMLLWAMHFNFDLKEYPHLSRYFSELMTRKSIQQSLMEEDINMSTAQA